MYHYITTVTGGFFMNTMDTEVLDRPETTTKQEVELPKQYKIVVHNDNKTTFELVIELMENIFYYSYRDAVKFAFTVDRQQRGIAAIYPSKELAEQKTNEAILYARARRSPLVITCEEV